MRTTTLSRALIMAALLTGATVAVSAARESDEQASPGCHSAAPNQGTYGAGNHLLYRMCQDQPSGSSDANSPVVGANNSHVAGASNNGVAGDTNYATNNK